MDDVLYGGDELARVLEPTVWIVGDTAFPILFNFVTVNEPFQWRSAVDNVPMCFLWDAG